MDTDFAPDELVTEPDGAGTRSAERRIGDEILPDHEVKNLKQPEQYKKNHKHGKQ